MSDKKPMGAVGIVLIGLVPILAAAGLAAAARYGTGSWERAGVLGAKVGGSLLLLGVVVFVAALIGHKLWYGSLEIDDEGKGGLSRMRDLRLERKAQKAAALEAAKLQDGQVSVATGAQGQLSVPEGR